MGTNQGSPLSSNLQTDYNNAKNSINSILGTLLVSSLATQQIPMAV